MDFQQRSTGDFTLSDKNADPTNWQWENESRASWTLANETMLKFRNKWYGDTTSKLHSWIPSPHLSHSNPLSKERTPTYPHLFSSGLLMTKAMTMCDTDLGQHGVIITGQSGNGKTLFNYYLLVRLLQLRQVVLYSDDGRRLYLFYHDGVYKPHVKGLVAEGIMASSSLPCPISPRSLSNGFMWSLFSIHKEKEPKSVLLNYPCFPVQATLPDPIRYHIWRKHRMPVMTGLPLWTREELAQGLRYQSAYQGLLDALSKFYARSSGPKSGDPLLLYNGTRALLEDRFGGDDVSPPSPEEAVDYLLDAAIGRFGYSARDVFDGVFLHDCMTQYHKQAFPIKYSELEVAVSGVFRHRGVIDYLPDILALNPIYYESPMASVRWEVDFKSDWVAKNVIWRLDGLGESDDEIRQLFKSLSFTKGSLTRRLLEPLVHRYIANATGNFWSLGSTNSNNADPPCFTLAMDSPVAYSVRFFQLKRQIIKLQSIATLSSCLENNTYYIPVDREFAMFDAFTIELDRAEKSAILWVVQLTTSRTPRGSSSSLAYKKVREIVAILKDELRGEAQDPPLKKAKALNGQAVTPQVIPSVVVRYLLVVPKITNESQIESKDLKWEFPQGWSQNREKHDHCGNVYCLEVPLTI